MAKKQNAALFNALNVPFKDAETANTAIQAFFDEAYELRKKHGLANVSIIVHGDIEESGPFMSAGHFGDSSTEEAMAAWNFGRAGADRQERIRNAISSGNENSLKGVLHRR